MPRDKTATYERISRCLKEEFLAYGYEKASLNRVSAKAGITTAGLYKHFINKEDMFFSLVKDTLDAFHSVAAGSTCQMKTEREYNPFDDDWAMFWVDFIYEHYDGVKLLICCAKGSEALADEVVRGYITWQLYLPECFRAEMRSMRKAERQAARSQVCADSGHPFSITCASLC